MRVLIVDDDAPVTQFLSAILSVEDGVEVVGPGCSGSEATERYWGLTPDILFMDIQIPDGGGLSAAEQILVEGAGARIVFLTTFSDNEYIVRALKMGARGYLTKQDIVQVAPALRSVITEICVLEGEVLERSTATGFGGPAGGREQTEEGPGASAKDLRSTAFVALTDREHEIVEAMAEGLDNAKAAAWLFMNEGTVYDRVSATLAELGLRNRTRVAAMYYRCAQTG